MFSFVSENHYLQHSAIVGMLVCEVAELLYWRCMVGWGHANLALGVDVDGYMVFSGLKY